MHVLKIFLSVLLVSASVGCKKILGIYGHPGRSHHILGEVILTKLAERGHEVTMVSAYPLKKPMKNYKDIYLDGFLEEINKDESIYLEMEKNHLLNFLGAFELIRHFANKTFAHPAMQKLINSGQKFDLIIMDWFCKDSELIYGNIFEAPIILTSSFGTQNEMNYLINNPEPYSYVPASGFDYSDEMNFFERLGNTFAVLYVEGILLLNKIRQQRILDYHFKNPPSIDELRGNVDLIFSNAHPVFESPRPYLPNVISIGGVHVRDPEPLPQELKQFLDKSTHGVVYFSLGSHMKTCVLSKETLKALLDTFSRLDQNVLLKWERDEVPELPHNVMVQKWMPQNSILAHPNVKAFITHGGLMSKIESIYHGVPTIGIPLFGDQKTNVAHSVHEGIGIKLYLRDLMDEDKLYKAITELIYDERYSRNIGKLSKLLRDQPMKPIDTAIYWAEFVMRNNGTKHLQNKSMRLYRFQNLLLDVVAVVLLTLVVLIKVCIVVIRKFSRKSSPKRSKIKKH